MKFKIKNFKLKISSRSEGNIVMPVLFITTAFAILLMSGQLVNTSFVDKTLKFGNPATESDTEKQNLQLKKVSFQPKPTPQEDSCNHDMNKQADPDTCECTAWLVKCEGGKCVDVDTQRSRMGGNKDEICKMFDDANWCDIFDGDGDGWYCIGKPVIYLYPEFPMFVDVHLTTAGQVIISDPLIEKTNGWNDIMAHPNGILFYKGHPYRELFYETSTQKVNPPQQGFVFSSNELETKLLEFITRLGLTRSAEQKEFMDWWIPRLKNFDTPYWMVSILDKGEKQRLDKVEIDPKPDTFIEFIVYFKPLDQHTEIKTLTLPPTPERLGFTAVEWGGIIDVDQSSEYLHP